MKNNYENHNKKQCHKAFGILNEMLTKEIGKEKAHKILFEGYDPHDNYMSVYMVPEVANQPFKVDARAVAERFYDDIMNMPWLYE